MFINSDFSDLLRIFNENGVRYLVIGGYALVQYAEPRFTKALDVWISTDPANATAVYQALLEFGAPLEGISASDVVDEGSFYQMGVSPVRIDILMDIPGMLFAEAWERRNVVIFDQLPVQFISREDLVTVRRAAGRPQDLIDVEHLIKAQRKK
jgi:hypothetical protein